MPSFNPFKHFRIVPRWIIFLFDMAVAVIAFLLSYLVYSAFQVDKMIHVIVFWEAFLMMGATAVSFYYFKLYSALCATQARPIPYAYFPRCYLV